MTSRFIAGLLIIFVVASTVVAFVGLISISRVTEELSQADSLARAAPAGARASDSATTGTQHGVAPLKLRTATAVVHQPPREVHEPMPGGPLRRNTALSLVDSLSLRQAHDPSLVRTAVLESATTTHVIVLARLPTNGASDVAVNPLVDVIVLVPIQARIMSRRSDLVWVYPGYSAKLDPVEIIAEDAALGLQVVRLRERSQLDIEQRKPLAYVPLTRYQSQTVFVGSYAPEIDRNSSRRNWRDVVHAAELIIPGADRSTPFEIAGPIPPHLLGAPITDGGGRLAGIVSSLQFDSEGSIVKAIVSPVHDILSRLEPTVLTQTSQPVIDGDPTQWTCAVTVGVGDVLGQVARVDMVALQRTAVFPAHDALKTHRSERSPVILEQGSIHPLGLRDPSSYSGTVAIPRQGSDPTTAVIAQIRLVLKSGEIVHRTPFVLIDERQFQQAILRANGTVTDPQQWAGPAHGQCLQLAMPVDAIASCRDGLGIVFSHPGQDALMVLDVTTATGGLRTLKLPYARGFWAAGGDVAVVYAPELKSLTSYRLSDFTRLATRVLTAHQRLTTVAMGSATDAMMIMRMIDNDEVVEDSLIDPRTLRTMMRFGGNGESSAFAPDHLPAEEIRFIPNADFSVLAWHHGTGTSGLFRVKSLRLFMSLVEIPLANDVSLPIPGITRTFVSLPNGAVGHFLNDKMVVGEVRPHDAGATISADGDLGLSSDIHGAILLTLRGKPIMPFTDHAERRFSCPGDVRLFPFRTYLHAERGIFWVYQDDTRRILWRSIDVGRLITKRFPDRLDWIGWRSIPGDKPQTRAYRLQLLGEALPLHCQLESAPAQVTLTPEGVLSVPTTLFAGTCMITISDAKGRERQVRFEIPAP